MVLYETDLLLDLAERKLQVLVELRELGLRQMALIEREDLSELLNVLEAKRQLIGSLHGVERQLDPYRGQAPESRTWRSPATRARCGETLDQCERLLAQIVTQEQTSEARLKDVRDQTAKRLDGAHAAGQARGAYAYWQGPATRQLDLASEG